MEVLLIFRFIDTRKGIEPTLVPIFLPEERKVQDGTSLSVTSLDLIAELMLYFETPINHTGVI
jgi:hypothetical protein